MAFYDSKPSTFEAVGNGSTLYRYNIQEVEAPATQNTEASGKQAKEEKRTQWQCDEVTIWHPLNANKVTEAVIASRWESNYEQKLINEFNAAQLGVYDEDEAKAKTEAYKAFLSERHQLKAQVDADCAENGIR